MVDVSQIENFLSDSLLQALEQNNLSFAVLLLEQYKANPSVRVFDRGLACIHYAAGMDDADVGEQIMEKMLKAGADPNTLTNEAESPLHVASFHGRVKIVKLLLEYGADYEARDWDNKTPINYAVEEYHHDVLKVFQDHIFELKKQIKMNENKNANKKFLTLSPINENFLTPNRNNYNFDVASPYYFNITHRKKRSTKMPLPMVEVKEEPLSSSSDESAAEECEESIKENLFKLTRNNLEKYSQNFATNKNRRSIVDDWKEKVNQFEPTRRVTGIADFESFFKDVSRNPFTSTMLSVDNKDDSFHTAAKFDESRFIKSPSKQNDFVCHIVETYRHTDNHSGVQFDEMKICPKSVDGTTEQINDSTLSTEIDIPLDYNSDDLRIELTQFGDLPGPITKSTKRLYMKRLMRYKRNPILKEQLAKSNSQITFSLELEKTLRQNEWQRHLTAYSELQNQLIEQFKRLNKDKLREGCLKVSFLYILIDPRITDNLPGKKAEISCIKTWEIFLKSIFYVGKGKSSRPYSHLYDAIKLYQRQNGEPAIPSIKSPIAASRNLFNESSSPRKTINESKKLARILDIWKSAHGVVCLNVFHNIMAAEAYSREAAIIDAINLVNLTNLKRGDYYGPMQSWTIRQRKQLGAILLYKAFQIYMAEGESQLKPTDVKTF